MCLKSIKKLSKLCLLLLGFRQIVLLVYNSHAWHFFYGLVFNVPNADFCLFFFPLCSDKDKEINEEELTGCILRKLGENSILNCLLQF